MNVQVIHINDCKLSPDEFDGDVALFDADKIIACLNLEDSFISIMSKSKNSKYFKQLVLSGHARVKMLDAVNQTPSWYLTPAGALVVLTLVDITNEEKIIALEKFLTPITSQITALRIGDTLITAKSFDTDESLWFIGVEVMRALNSNYPASALSRIIIRHERELVARGHIRKNYQGRVPVWTASPIGVFLLLVYSRAKYNPNIIACALVSAK